MAFTCSSLNGRMEPARYLFPDSGRLLNMGTFVNPSNERFRVALNSEIYVDKSGLIEYINSVLNTKEAFICNSRPRRFGKSTAADMLVAYYSRGCDSRAMFSSLEAGRLPSFEKNLNAFDVIRIDIQWCLGPAGGKDKVVSFLTESIIRELGECYPEIVSSESTSLPLVLDRIRNETGRKFIVIIDEWDVLIRDDSNADTQNGYVDFLRNLFKGGEEYIALAYLTGILPILREKTQPALNNFEEYTMLSPGPLARYFGFNEDEVKNLCLRYNRDYNEVERWYDGYRLGDYHVYNPRSVV